MTDREKALEEALRKIRAAYSGECGCVDHVTEDCCNAVGEPCAFCLSSAALALPASGSEPSGRVERCPTCTSPSPELHPAVQYEGEVEVCRDSWHSPIACVPEPEPSGEPEKATPGPVLCDLSFSTQKNPHRRDQDGHFCIRPTSPWLPAQTSVEGEEWE